MLHCDSDSALTRLHCVFSLSSENLIRLKGPSSPLNSLFDIEKVDLKAALILMREASHSIT